MATSSITKNFVISGKEQVEMFVNAIEESAKNRPVHIPVAASEITDDAVRRCEACHGGRRKRQAGKPAKAHGAVHHTGGRRIFRRTDG